LAYSKKSVAAYGEQIAESGYAAAYPGGSTSWLRIEAHLQHLEELVNPPIQTKIGLGEPCFKMERFAPEEDVDISELLEVLECEEA
jgi:hypothetical protein